MSEMVRVVLLEPYQARGGGPRLNAGERAALPRTEAETLIASGGAAPDQAIVRALDEPPAKRMIERAHATRKGGESQ